MPLAIPIAMAASTGIGALMQGRASASARKQQQPLINAQSALAAQQAAISKLAGPALTESSDYYRRLLTGNRAALTSALSPEITSITDLFRGATKNLERTAAGPGRDVAMAELNRDRVGKISGLLPQARRSAAEGLTNLGAIASGQANASAGIYGSLLNNSRADRVYTDANHEALGESIGPLLIDFYKAWQNRAGGSIGKLATGVGSLAPTFGGGGWG